MRQAALKALRRLPIWATAALALASCQSMPETALATSSGDTVDGAAMRAVDAPANAGNWMSYGRDWGEQRYSPLTRINDGNVSQLGLAWFDDLETMRGVQATPLAVDGVLYKIGRAHV